MCSLLRLFVLALALVTAAPAIVHAQPGRAAVTRQAPRPSLWSRLIARIRPPAQTVQFRANRRSQYTTTLGRRAATKRTASVPAEGVAARSVSRLVERTVQNGRAVRRNVFYTRRDRQYYGEDLPDLEDVLTGAQRARGRSGHWVDLGAGDGNATREYMEQAGRSGVRVTAVSYRTGDASVLRQWQAAARRSSPRSRYLVGSYLQDYAAEDIGSADLVTDLYGPATYSRHVDEVIFQAGTLAREGGHILMRTVLDPALARRWLAQAEGLEVVKIEADGRYEGNGVYLHLRRTGSPLRLRALELVSIGEGTLPRRGYEIGSTFVGDAHAE